jgi:hypothetical protein
MHKLKSAMTQEFVPIQCEVCKYWSSGNVVNTAVTQQEHCTHPRMWYLTSSKLLEWGFNAFHFVQYWDYNLYLYISEKSSSSLTFIVTVYAHVYRFYVQKCVSASDT